MFKTIPLNKLVQSPRNVRRHTDAAADAELKAGIAARGLLQNLVVRPAARGKSRTRSFRTITKSSASSSTRQGRPSRPA